MGVRRREEEELPVVRAAYEFALWLIPKIGKFPRDLRFTLGERLENAAMGILESLIRARFSNERAGILTRVNLELDVLRHLIRLAKDLQCLPLKSFGEGARRLVEIGQQVGAWKKSLKGEGTCQCGAWETCGTNLPRLKTYTRRS